MKDNKSIEKKEFKEDPGRYNVDELETVEVIDVVDHGAFQRNIKEKEQGTDGASRTIWK